MEYNVVFDISQSGYRPSPFIFIPLIFVVIGIGSVIFRKHLAERWRGHFPFAFLGFAIVVSVMIIGGTAADSYALASALRKGRCKTVEGVVSDFHPMPASGHDMEWFEVGGRRFRYSDYVITAGFNNTASHGGPMRKGLQVRVHYRGNEIAKLEVAR